MTQGKCQIIISADELFEFLFSTENGGEELAMLYHAYIDDSADRNRERLVISGAIIGDKDKWRALGKAWKSRLGHDNLDYFKSSQCRSLSKQFHKFRSIENGRQLADKVQDDLDQLIRDYKFTTLGVVVSIPLHAKLLSDSTVSVPRVPYRMAFQNALAECAKGMCLLGRNNIVTFGHDDGEDFPILFKIYKEFKQLNPKWAQRMADFVPLDDKLHPETQAADVVASVIHKYAEAWATNPTRDNLQRLRNSMYKIVFIAEQKDQDEAYRDKDYHPAEVEYVTAY